MKLLAKTWWVFADQVFWVDLDFGPLGPFLLAGFVFFAWVFLRDLVRGELR